MEINEKSANIYLLFLKERLKLAEKTLDKVKKLDTYNKLLPEIKAYQDCLSMFRILFSVKNEYGKHVYLNGPIVCKHCEKEPIYCECEHG